MTGFWSIIVPQATINLCTNPSFEGAATNWAAGSGHSLAQSNAQSFKGAYSGAVTIGGTGTVVATYAISGLTASAKYYLSCWVLVTSMWDGGDIYLYADSFTGVTQTVNSKWTMGVSSFNQWTYLETYVVLDTDTAGNFQLVTGSGSRGGVVYLDAVQFENGTAVTTYCDGEQPGCIWSGTKHLSTSSRSGQARDGGILYNLDSLYSYVVETTGIGIPPITSNIQRTANYPGQFYKGFKTQARTLALVFDAIGTSRANLHSLRKSIINYISPESVKDAQPFKLRYSGANSSIPVDITCVYAGGMEWGRTDGFTQRITLALTANDPYYYEMRDQATHMGAQQALSSVNRSLQKVNYVWSKMGTGLNDAVRCAAVAPNGNLYVGGDFTTAGGANVYYIAYWDGTAWNSIGAGPGLNSLVYDMAFDAAGNLYVAGLFTDVHGGGGGTYNRVVKWDGSNWSALGTGTNGLVHAVIIDSTHGYIYVGGEFTTAGGTTVNNIAYWDGSSWNAMGGATKGCNNHVLDVINGNGGSIIAAGEFSQAGGSAYPRIARWDGSNWQSMNTATLDSGSNYVKKLLTYPDGSILACGSFTGPNGNYLSRYNGAYWNAFAVEPNQAVREAAIDKDGNTWMAGYFTAVGNLAAADYIAVWNGSIWSLPDVDFPGSPLEFAFMFRQNGDQYVFFSTAGTATTSAAYTVTNSGTARAYPIITIKRSGGDSTILKWIKNETTGKTLWFDEYAMLDGEELIIDLRPERRSVRSNVVGIASYAFSQYYTQFFPSANRWDALLPNSDTSEFYLMPGSNTLTVYATESGSPTVSVYAVATIKHLAADGAAA